MYNPAVICVCETWLHGQLTDAYVCPSDYTVFRKDRLNRGGGGVATFVRKDIHAEVVSFDLGNCDIDIDVIGIDLTFDTQKIRVIVCYRPPYYTTEDVKYIERLLTTRWKARPTNG